MQRRNINVQLINPFLSFLGLANYKVYNMSSLLHPNKRRDDRLRRSLIRLFLKRDRSAGEKINFFQLYKYRIRIKRR